MLFEKPNEGGGGGGGGETVKGKTQSKEKGIQPRPLRISLPCQYLFQILNLVSDWLLKLVPRHDRGHTL